MYYVLYSVIVTNHRATHTLIHTYGQFILNGPPTGMDLYGGREPENSEKPIARHRGDMHSDSNPGSGSNPGPCSCEVTSLLQYIFLIYKHNLLEI